MSRFHTLRGRLMALSVLVAFLAIAILTFVFNVLLDRSLDSAANDSLRSRAAAVRSTVAVDRGRLHLRESAGDAAVDGRVWVYEGTRALERPLGGRPVQRTANALAGRGRIFRDLPGRDFRLYADPIHSGGHQVGTVVVGESLTAYDRTTDLALGGSLGLGAVLLAAMVGISSLVVRRALSPVREMTRSAADWSEHAPERRFGTVSRPDELEELARTFDALLGRVAASLRHEQRLTAELSHELRTPLSRIVAELDLLQRRERPAEERAEALEAIGRGAEQMRGIIETLMRAARADAGLDGGRAHLQAIFERLQEQWGEPLASRDIELRLVPAGDGDATVGVEAEVVERILAPVLDNAGRFARTMVTVRVAGGDGRQRIAVTDDGPGVAPRDEPLLFEPGATAGGNGHGGAGLGLALARRLARAAGGDLVFAPVVRGGATFVVELPA